MHVIDYFLDCYYNKNKIDINIKIEVEIKVKRLEIIIKIKIKFTFIIINSRFFISLLISILEMHLIYHFLDCYFNKNKIDINIKIEVEIKVKRLEIIIKIKIKLTFIIINSRFFISLLISIFEMHLIYHFLDSL